MWGQGESGTPGGPSWGQSSMDESRGPEIPYMAAKFARDSLGFAAALDSGWHYVGQPEKGATKVALMCVTCRNDVEALPYRMAGKHQLFVTIYIGRCVNCGVFYWLCEDANFAARVLKEPA